MGVQSLWDIVGPSARPVRLEALSRKKLAVDASIWIYQFLKAVRDKEGNALPQSHIVGFFRRICKLLYFGILPIFVFDGGVPILKRETINERKNRRQKKSESTRETAQKLLAIQLQREAENKHTRPKQTNKKISNSKDFNEDDDLIYFEDLPINKAIEEDSNTKSPESKLIKFRRKDEYHLPDLHEFKVSKNDERIMPDEEYEESYDDFDTVDGININEVDPKSKEFDRIPVATQYMILNHLRLKSRLRMGYRKDQLEDLFPNSMDFSRFQIQQVQRRNFFTQKLMNVTGMGEDTNVVRRIAGDKDKKYALVKNDDGWTLALENDGTNENSIHLDDDDVREIDEYAKESKVPITIKDETAEEDSDEDFEDVPLEGPEETEEEKNMHRAMIESIYERFKEKPTVKEPKDSEEFDEVELKKAVQESKDEYFKMIEKENNLDNELNDDDKDLDFGSSILFTNNDKADIIDDVSHGDNIEFKKPIKNKTIDKVKISETNGTKSYRKKLKKSLKDDMNSNNLSMHNLRNELPGKPNETRKKSNREMNNLGSAFLFNPDFHQTGQISIDNDQEKEKESSNLDNATLELDKEPFEEKKESSLDVSENKPQKKTETVFERMESDEENDALIRNVTITESPKGKRKLPEWFQNEVGRTLNPHNEKFIAYNEYNHKKRQDQEDQEAGLIPWYEAREYLQEGQKTPEANDDDEIEEISPTIPVKRVEKEKTPDEQPQRKAAVIDYDFEEEEEDNLIKQLQSEEIDHEELKSQIKTSHNLPISSFETRITDEQLLQEQLQKAKRDSDEVTESMIYDVQELLKRFGIPYMTAPMEAEAQCAELLKLGLVDGIVTDDSDCFLFGGDKIYKNMFNQKQYVECYLKDDIRHKIGLSQENMIELALLLGSDYTEGIKGIGPVLAMEILAEFGSLKSFKGWFDENTKSSKAIDKKDVTSLQKNLLTRIKNGKLYLPDNFPEKVVFDAYILPTVDHDKTKFKWGVPNLDQIRSFLMYNVQWSQARVDEVMIPLIRDMNKKKAEGTQSTIGEFFPQEYIQTRKELNLGKRMKTAANKLNKRRKM
ncbi:unnamed protein product [Candida verbasci]|uniref:DNA repair protein RAD2 n=1 Tax=Candida verbasci TaxID=1227364 RepID=A0A9W4XEI2_9ASCO|nr:unnamed protein product [Candida verbasci]